jgi:hypothetical protein
MASTTSQVLATPPALRRLPTRRTSSSYFYSTKGMSNTTATSYEPSMTTLEVLEEGVQALNLSPPSPTIGRIPLNRRESAGVPPAKPSRMPLTRQESVGRAAFARELVISETRPSLSRHSSAQPVPLSVENAGTITVMAADPPAAPSGLLTKTFTDFALECGEVLSEATVAYQTWGRLNKAKDNLILICHSLTSGSDADTWWGSLLGPALAFDTEKYFIVCCNVLGSPVRPISFM